MSGQQLAKHTGAWSLLSGAVRQEGQGPGQGRARGGGKEEDSGTSAHPPGAWRASDRLSHRPDVRRPAVSLSGAAGGQGDEEGASPLPSPLLTWKLLSEPFGATSDSQPELLLCPLHTHIRTHTHSPHTHTLAPSNHITHTTHTTHHTHHTHRTHRTPCASHRTWPTHVTHTTLHSHHTNHIPRTSLPTTLPYLPHPPHSTDTTRFTLSKTTTPFLTGLFRGGLTQFSQCVVFLLTSPRRPHSSGLAGTTPEPSGTRLILQQPRWLSGGVTTHTSGYMLLLVYLMLRLSMKQKNNVAFIFSTILLTYWIESVISNKECISG